ncbi:hypothetical protein GF371_05570, partial [Candidatus Woesearchaeota archaeon]|nr:hypothetical protein [Candidatus Woesearchaeota archaeon]
GGFGGGAIKLIAEEILTFDGIIETNGTVGEGASSYDAGGGSGGSIWVTADTLTGSGIFVAGGGNGFDGTSDGGGGAGGRIAVYYNSTSWDVSDFTQSEIKGGSGHQGAEDGQVGTLVYVDDDDDDTSIFTGFWWQDNDAIGPHFNFRHVNMTDAWVRVNGSVIVNATEDFRLTNVTLNDTGAVTTTKFIGDNVLFDSDTVINLSNRLHIVYNSSFNDTNVNYALSPALTIENNTVAQIEWINSSLSGLYNLSANVRLGANRAFVNSTSIDRLNTTANITLYNISLTNPEPFVDVEDDGTFVRCTAGTNPACVELSYTGTTYKFNTTHFTTFEARQPNTLPNVSQVTLNSSLGTNTSAENLTLYYTVSDSDGEPVKNITNWYVNNVSLMVLKMLFEGGSTEYFTPDYSVYGNNGTVKNGTTWSSSAGFDSWGAYQFDGTDDYIEIADDSSLDLTSAITIEARVKSTEDGYVMIVPVSTAPQTVFRENFVSGQTATSQCNSFKSFKASLSSGKTYTRAIMNGTNDVTGVICTGSNANTICQNIRSNASGSVSCAGNTWNFGACGAGREVNINQTICQCPNPGYVFRPCITNSNWGGINTATCGGPTQNMSIICEEASSITGYAYSVSTSGGGEFIINSGGTVYNVTAGGNINDDAWHHLVATFDGSEMKIYIDGSLQNNNSAYSGSLPTGSGIYLGRNFTEGDPVYFNGTMDEVRIYNRALSAEQIDALYKNLTDLIVSQETTAGEEWRGCITPTDDEEAGNETCSNNLTVLTSNTPPNTTQVFMNSSLGTNTSSESLNCYANATDAEETSFDIDYRWYNNSVEVVQLAGTASNVANATLALVSTLGAGNTTKGENWTCEVRADDGTDIEPDWNNATNSIIILNSLPTQDQPILNSSNLQNRTDENLTVYPQNVDDNDGDAVQEIINWYRNGTSITVLNMPFENTSNDAGQYASVWAKDYSGYGNNGTVYGAALWNQTGGYDGFGAYEFDGSDDFINISNTAQLNQQGDMSISTWVNTAFGVPAGQSRSIVEKWQGGSIAYPYVLRQNPGGFAEFADYNGSSGGSNSVVSTTRINDSAWHHVVAVRNNQTGRMLIYIDGSLENNNSRINKGSISNSHNVFIGSRANISNTHFNGTIDNARIYNRALTSAQILALYRNKTDTIVSEETIVGDVWHACVTPNDQDPDGQTNCSENMTIREELCNINGTITDAFGSFVFSTVNLYNSTGGLVTSDDESYNMSVECNNKYDFEVKPSTGSFNSLRVINLSLSTADVNEVVDLEDSAETVESPESGNWSEVIAWNPNSTITYDYISINFTYNDTDLGFYKCVNWSYTTQNCTDDNWTLITESIPDNYTQFVYNFTPGDPEVGVADKPNLIGFLNIYDVTGLADALRGSGGTFIGRYYNGSPLNLSSGKAYRIEIVVNNTDNQTNGILLDPFHNNIPDELAIDLQGIDSPNVTVTAGTVTVNPFTNTTIAGTEAGTTKLIWDAQSPDKTVENLNYPGDQVKFWYVVDYTTAIESSNNLTSFIDVQGTNKNDLTLINPLNTQAPDLFINSTYIDFSDSNPKENENITINATVFNLGSANATNVTVQFFDGNETHGTQINGNVTVNISANSNVTVNMTWLAVLGPHNITVVVDPPTATNGSIAESDETNNVDNKTLNTQSYHTFYGSIFGNLTLRDAGSNILYNWLINDYQGSVLVTDVDSSIDFISLKALGWNDTGGRTSGDFDDADANLNITGWNDSTKKLWTNNGGVALFNSTFNLTRQSITDVPVINSTNSSDFITGILWDDSDDTDNEYDTSDKEDLVFVTNIKDNTVGKYGAVDYEIRVPVRLEEYAAGSDLLAFYIQLK